MLKNYWTTSIQYLKGIGPRKAMWLSKLGIFTVGDLLEHYPRRYEDRSALSSIAGLCDGQLGSFRAQVLAITESKPRRGLCITKMSVGDGSGIAQVIWFNQPHVKKDYMPGQELFISGKIKITYQIEVHSAEIEVLEEEDQEACGHIIPVYAATAEVNQRWLRRLVQQVLAEWSEPPEVLPKAVCEKFALMDRGSAMRVIHCPDTLDRLEEARRRLVFEELYLLQCGLLLLKQQQRGSCRGVKHGPDGNLSRQAGECLPFTLTHDQQQVLQEIKWDMEDFAPMQRLVQGDVGSGKTAVAALALIKTVENGFQGALMVPTEILAEQHYQTFNKLFSSLGVKIALLTGRLSRKARTVLLAELAAGKVDIVIGTHALLQEDVVFNYLGMVVTDEQHRFGVRQRGILQGKGEMPDVLVMTATPIPRTMALTVYGDLEVSSIRQLPPGRKAIRTFTRAGDRRILVYQFVVEQVKAGRQAYVVCPLVEESDKIVAAAATELYERLSAQELKEVRCGLVHGRMKAAEKEAVMEGFYRGDIQVLVATTVIEVGVNVPNASVMVIEGADRFGLAQLHQLRGRIGRGEHQSYCILLSDSKNPDTKERLEIMTATGDGFVLAEEDLKLRGPGQFFGTRQHGLPDLKIADIIQDVSIFLTARQAAEESLKHSDTAGQLRQVLHERFGERLGMLFLN